MPAITSPTTSSGAPHSGTLAHLTGKFFTPGTDFLLMMILVLIFLLLWMPVTREILKGIFGTLLMPALTVILMTSGRWIIKTVRTIWDAHAVLLRNLYSSHRDIHPTLEDPPKK